MSASRSCSCNSPPVDTPASLGGLAVRLEVEVDLVGVAGDLVRQCGSTGFTHQHCSVVVADLQVGVNDTSFFSVSIICQ